jgi:murein tripeptide amidase MpaA
VQLGETLDGHDLDCIRVGPVEPGRPRVWIIARQHPGESSLFNGSGSEFFFEREGGERDVLSAEKNLTLSLFPLSKNKTQKKTGETQAEYFAEGLLRRLLDDADATGRAARAAATFFVVPNMNPDGSWRGHLRTNAAGVNLNRAWKEPVDREEAPEVALVLDYMDEVGVDFLCDVHGDEAIPAVFAAGCEGVPSFDDTRAEMQSRFYKTLAMMCPEFQTTVGYPRTGKGKANLSLAKNAIAERFQCLAMTLEMPFIDVKTEHGLYAAGSIDGWTPQRSAAFGADYLGAILDALPALRAKREAEDADK